MPRATHFSGCSPRRAGPAPSSWSRAARPTSSASSAKRWAPRPCSQSRSANRCCRPTSPPTRRATAGKCSAGRRSRRGWHLPHRAWPTRCSSPPRSSAIPSPRCARATCPRGPSRRATTTAGPSRRRGCVPVPRMARWRRSWTGRTRRRRCTLSPWARRSPSPCTSRRASRTTGRGRPAARPRTRACSTSSRCRANSHRSPRPSGSIGS
mmetsp:Transcript_2368/g.5793  ORF Transcript_2368/g.5793 Transcript_2368/m.5793 type:complete len:209 (+) Transcript_2368:295-921(+)